MSPFFERKKVDPSGISHYSHNDLNPRPPPYSGAEATEPLFFLARAMLFFAFCKSTELSYGPIMSVKKKGDKSGKKSFSSVKKKKNKGGDPAAGSPTATL